MAELGLSGKFLDEDAAAAAFFRAAMASLNDVAALGFVEELGPTLAVKLLAPETGLGLPWSRSSNCFDLGSKESIILRNLSTKPVNRDKSHLRFCLFGPSLCKNPKRRSHSLPNFGVSVRQTFFDSLLSQV